MAGAVRIDGSMGEGGGQVLRSALTLSALTGRSLHLVHIRAGRAKPGLMPQHLQSVEATAAISGAKTTGAELGSQELQFLPGPIVSGTYHFDIGTAGATSLVLQTVALPLAAAGRASSVTITGGTHVPNSPAFHYLQRQWSPFLSRVGLGLTLSMPRAGFYPRGGGRLDAVIQPAAGLHPLQLVERGQLREILCLSFAANLPLQIAERQSLRAEKRLSGFRSLLQVKTSDLPAVGRGTLLFLQAEFEHSSACYFALGARGKPAERVADEAADALLSFLAADGAVDEYLADQLVLPLALAEGISVLKTARITRHLVTNLEVVNKFLPTEWQVDGPFDAPGLVHIRGVPWPHAHPP